MPSRKDPRSEFEGGGVQRNTLFPVEIEDMPAGDKLRLRNITGQDADPRAQPDPYFWQGGIDPGPYPPAPDEVEVLKDPGRY